MSACSSIILFFQRIFCCRGGKLGKLIDEGSNRIDREFDVVKIVKRLRNLKIILKEVDIISDSLKAVVKSKGINVIDLDSDSVK